MVRSIFPIIGGKSEMIKDILGVINKIPHKNFVDLFGGSGKVVLSYVKTRDLKGRVIYNDKDPFIYNVMIQLKENARLVEKKLKEIATLFNTMDENPVKLIKQYKKYIMKKKLDVFKDKIEMAAWTLIVYHSIYGGSIQGAISIFRRNNFFCLLRRASDKFFSKKIQPLLKKIEMYNEDYKDFIRKHSELNNRDTLLFVDPPYLGYENEYNTGEKDVALEVLDFLEREWKGSIVFTHNAEPTKELLKKNGSSIVVKYEKLMEKLRKYGYSIVYVDRTSRIARAGTTELKHKEIIAYKTPSTRTLASFFNQ